MTATKTIGLVTIELTVTTPVGTTDLRVAQINPAADMADRGKWLVQRRMISGRGRWLREGPPTTKEAAIRRLDQILANAGKRRIGTAEVVDDCLHVWAICAANWYCATYDERTRLVESGESSDIHWADPEWRVVWTEVLSANPLPTGSNPVDARLAFDAALKDREQGEAKTKATETASAADAALRALLVVCLDPEIAKAVDPMARKQITEAIEGLIGAEAPELADAKAALDKTPVRPDRAIHGPGSAFYVSTGDDGIRDRMECFVDVDSITGEASLRIHTFDRMAVSPNSANSITITRKDPTK